MTTTDQLDRAVADPIGLITDLVTDAEEELGVVTIRTVVTAVADGRARSRQVARALAVRFAALTDGRSPAPRMIGDLLIEFRKAGAPAIAGPVCAECGKQLRTLRTAEAKLNGWLGGEEGLRVSLEAARNKLTAVDRTRNQNTARTADPGIPQIRKP
ncbi:hypothetical protein SUDANB15_00256 [Streptomyces sp. enrichment culture]|uniref:hypothetical protein n=1 Tax=Streptomyces sp. enrichment culture TaxID=1795815 RepID=UPI003F547B2B